jgi:nucleoside-diphosphate-sugar epimerase
MQNTVLILGGSGKIGSHSASAFADAGWTVRQYDRSTQDMVGAAQGVDVIVNGLNPPAYHDWEHTIPAITAQVIAAAKSSGATVIVPGNIYNFGNQPGVLDETTPQRAHTRKGRVRIAMEHSYRDAGVRTIILRAGNFIDPAGNSDVMRMLYLRDIAKGRITATADVHTLQAYAFVPDWARAAVALAQRRDSLARFEDVPFPGHAFSIETLRQTLAAYLDRDLRISQFPWWAMTLLAPVWELAKEMREMRYLYAMPHEIGRAKFDRLLPDFQETPLQKVLLAGLPPQINPDQSMRTNLGQIA